MDIEKYYDELRMVVVTTACGEKLIGELETLADLSHTKLMLKKVRRLAMVSSTKTKGMNGPIVSLEMTALILPVDINDGPVDSMLVSVASIYRVKEQPGLMKKLDGLLRQAADDELRLRAESSGIITR